MPDAIYSPSKFGSGEFGAFDAFGNAISGVETMVRDDVASNAALTLTSQALRLAYFTAPPSSDAAVMTKINTYSGGTAAGATPSICRAGLYLIAANGDGTLVASCANTTSLWAATNTEYSTNLSVSYTVVPGQRYAIGLLCVTAAAAPTICGAAPVAITGLYNRTPKITATLTGQADLPATFTDASLAAFAGKHYSSLTAA